MRSSDKTTLTGSILFLTLFLPPAFPAQETTKTPTAEQIEKPTFPICRHCPDPVYPSQARQAKISDASVVLEITITERGKVDPDDIRVINDPGYGFAIKAVDAVRGWTFKPATKNGKPIMTRTKVQIVFRLAK